MKEFPNIRCGIDYNLDVQETAQRQTSAVLQKHPDLKASSAPTCSAPRALPGRGQRRTFRRGQDRLLGCHAGPDPALKDGKVDLVLAQRPYQIGQLAVEWGYKYLTQKAKVPKKVIPGSSSSPARTWTPRAARSTSTSKRRDAENTHAQAA